MIRRVGRSRRLCRPSLASVAIVLVVGAAVGGVALGGTAGAVGERAGDATVINGRNGSELLDRGGSATSFSLRLPEAAACPGDSASQNYRVQTFVVPATDDPARLTYESQGPAGNGRWALYDVNTTPVVQALTEMAAGPGQPGRITPLPQLSFAVFPPGTFPDGRYRIGVACTAWSETMRFWDTEIDIVADPADDPAQLQWAVVGAPGPTGTAEVPLLVGMSVIGVVVAVLVLALRRRRARPPLNQPSRRSARPRPTPTQEQP
jgi:hypothetical protein